ncbi:MAG: thioesterase, partial [Flavobacteriaceae bacterium]|nr:thioesterase [Flavobacteriaceae bacterium]
NKPQTLWLNSTGKNSDGQVVSSFKFEWTLKPKN